MSDLVRLSRTKCFKGYLDVYEFTSKSLGETKTKFSIYVPESANNKNKVPIVYFLSGFVIFVVSITSQM